MARSERLLGWGFLCNKTNAFLCLNIDGFEVVSLETDLY